jgi:hypothetical protein
LMRICPRAGRTRGLGSTGGRPSGLLLAACSEDLMAPSRVVGLHSAELVPPPLIGLLGELKAPCHLRHVSALAEKPVCLAELPEDLVARVRASSDRDEPRPAILGNGLSQRAHRHAGVVLRRETRLTDGSIRVGGSNGDCDLAADDERQDCMSASSDGSERASAVITVNKYDPVPYEEPADGPGLMRIHVEESFSGDIVGDGVVEFLQVARADGSASFVGIERVTGKVAGKEGTFVLQDAGTVEGNIVSGDWFVVPRSGTGQLTGLRGAGGFRANLGEGAQVHLDYWFE